jgi:CRISPR type III-B/RAMP module RAMP protein Cmr6
MGSQYFLPEDTERILLRQEQACRNLGLMLDKYVPQRVILESKNKADWFRRLNPNQHVDLRLAKAAYDRWAQITKAAGAIHMQATTDWRMVVGLGGESVLETDITLHHIYGFPFIPGSALKGLVRMYAALEDKNMYLDKGQGEKAPSKEIDTDPKDILRIFGSQEMAGSVVFFDAMPLDGRATLALDIMNPHYPKYYGDASNRIPPTNDQDPNPVTFLAVEKTTFVFALAPRRPGNSEDLKDVQQVQQWLKDAIQRYGVGAKTNAGYGYFTSVR